jgi:hypothetical protein
MTEKGSSQQSAISAQLFPKQRSAPCRILCDETAEDFRLTLCRTFCAGICPERKESDDWQKDCISYCKMAVQSNG